MPPPVFNRNTQGSFGDSFGKFITHPAVQGTAAVAPAVLAVAPALMMMGHHNRPPPMPRPMPPPQPRPRQPGDEDVDQNGNPRQPGQQMQRMAALKVANGLIAGGIKMLAKAAPTITTLSEGANVVNAGAAVAGAMRSNKQPPQQPQPAQPTQQNQSQPKPQQQAVMASFRGAMKKADGEIVPPIIAPRPAPPGVGGGSSAQRKQPATGASPGAAQAFKAPGKTSALAAAIGARAHDFGVGAKNSLAAGLNDYLTPTTEMDPPKFHNVDASNPLR